MTHLLPPHGTPLPPDSQHMQHVFVPNQGPMGDMPMSEQDVKPDIVSTPAPTARKRKKQEASADGTPHTPAEPRRLRRSHEACARCRNKKIKCDSKHPKCSACASAGVDCHQEDRYHQRLTPRGHTEQLQAQRDHAEVILKSICGPDFDLALATQTGMIPYPYLIPGPPGAAPGQLPSPNMDAPGPSQHHGPPNVVLYPAGIFPPGMIPASMPPPPHMLSHSAYMHGPPAPESVLPEYGFSQTVLKGVDPQKNDVTNERAVAQPFHVPPLLDDVADSEDLAVGSSGLASERDRNVHESSAPKDSDRWMPVVMRRNTLAMLIHMVPPAESISIYLPRNRETMKRVVKTYFDHLNVHRPVFSRHQFEDRLEALYENRGGPPHDPGFICSLYLILALGTLCEINNVVGRRGAQSTDPMAVAKGAKHLMPSDWPDHEAFFERALTIKPDLRVTISSLQALILLHWFLYTERQGRSLWRLVGCMVRIGVELGLHHDPRSQLEAAPGGNGSTFNEDDCHTRIRLWDIVMIHDRGTSILLGRPLGIYPNDSNTPGPSANPTSTQPEFSEHYRLSRPVAEIQSDIVVSLYSPHTLSGHELVGHVSRILKSLTAFRHKLGDKYKHYFEGTRDWHLDKRIKLVNEVGIDEGLTLLKLGITRLLLMRALFRHENGVSPDIQRHALRDAVITAHNIVVIHNQLIRFPDAAFFVSPIPLHISAWTILIGHSYKCDALEADVIQDDIWMALDMLPRFRWRWDRKDHHGGHPPIHEIAQKMLKADFSQGGPVSHPVLLMEEVNWTHVDLTTPPDPSDASSMVIPHGGLGAKLEQYMPAFPPSATGGLYPFYPENPLRASDIPVMDMGSDRPAVPGSDHSAYMNGIWPQPGPSSVYQQSSSSYMAEERDVAPATHSGPAWMQHAEPGGGPSS